MSLSVGSVNNPSLVSSPNVAPAPMSVISGGGTLQGMDINGSANQQYFGKSLVPTATPGGGGNTSPNTPGGGGVVAAAAGPTAAEVAAAARIAQGRTDFNNNQNSANDSFNTAIDAGARGQNSSILDYLSGRLTQSNIIDAGAVQNQLAREQGQQGIMDMVGNGIRSSGAVLGNKNAGSSSATEAIANAYGTLGRQQSSSVGNQFAQGQNKTATDEANLALADATQARHSGEDKLNTIKTIVDAARDKLTYLNQQAAYASIPDRIDILNRVAQVKQQATDALSAYDNTLSKGIAGQPSMSSDAINAKATGLMNAGTAPQNPFNYTSVAPAQFQDTGQFASSLPIFIAPKKQLA